MEDANDVDPIAHPLKWLWHKWNWHQYQTPPWANQLSLFSPCQHDLLAHKTICSWGLVKACQIQGWNQYMCPLPLITLKPLTMLSMIDPTEVSPQISNWQYNTSKLSNIRAASSVLTMMTMFQKWPWPFIRWWLRNINPVS